MRQINRALRRARGLAPAVVLAAALAAGGTVAAAPASAAAGPLGLTVQPPSSIGAAGGPVEFTETIDNQGDQSLAVTLELAIDSATGTPPHALSLDDVNGSGAWEHLPLTVRTEADRTVTTGVTGTITVPPGGTDVRLRIGAPMGEPHNGASNGGVGPALVLRSTVKGAPDSPTDTHRIVVGSIANSVVGVPGTAVAGGAPIEFEVHLTNPTPSAYTNLGNVLFADRRARVEARAADGNWVSLEPVVTIPDDPAGFYVNGPDSSAEPGSDQVAKVRVSYPAGMPLGGTALNPCVFVNEGEGHPFQGTTMCSAGAEVQVVAPAAPAPSTAPDRTGAPAAAGARPAADVTPQAAAITDDKPVIAADGGVTPWAANPAEGELAATGTDLHWAGSAGVAALLLGAGGAGLILVRRRRATR